MSESRGECLLLCASESGLAAFSPFPNVPSVNLMCPCIGLTCLSCMRHSFSETDSYCSTEVVRHGGWKENISNFSAAAFPFTVLEQLKKSFKFCGNPWKAQKIRTEMLFSLKRPGPILSSLPAAAKSPTKLVRGLILDLIPLWNSPNLLLYTNQIAQ